MKTLTFNQLKYMDREELRNTKFLIQQDMNPKYCSEPSRLKMLKKLYNYIKYLMYNPVAKQA